MTRQLRFDPPGGWHHVMHRGNRRQPIFNTTKDRFNFLARLGQMTELTDLEIHAFALMDNHYHLLVHCPTAGLSEGLRRANAAYAQDYNRRNEVDGHLFRGRFRSLIIESDHYLVEVLRYIHRNPVEAGIAPSAIQYPWSSQRAYAAGAGGPAWLHQTELLDYFNGDRDRLVRFVDAPDSAAARRVVEAIDQCHPAIGGPQFIADLLEAHPPTPETAASAGRVLQPSPPDLAAAETAIAASLGIPSDILASKQSRRPPSFSILLAVLHRELGCTQTELADRYCYRGRTSVASAIARCEQRAGHSATFAERYRQAATATRSLASQTELADTADATPTATQTEIADTADATPTATQTEITDTADATPAATLGVWGRAA